MSAPETLGVVGLGYVGLPVALLFARNGMRVLGFDVDAHKVEQINRGASYIRHLPASEIRQARESGRLEASTDFSRVAECQAVILCVPTPLKGEREPDLGFVLGTGQSIAPHLRPGTLVVLESTTYPGTTDGELRAVLETGSGMTAGVDFHLAYSPEREDPGNPDSRVAEIPKVVGGLTPGCRDRALALYGRVVRRLVPVANCRVAEAVKLTENIFRAVNIAMVNELKLVYGAMDIDIWEVIDAARTKPFGYMAFYPGPGLGGHCIPIDPFYLSWKAREFGQRTRFIELAGEVNTAMPAHVVARCREALGTVGRTPAGARVLLLGMAYKPGVDDDRESPAYVIWRLLEEAGAEVRYHDPWIPVIRPSREHLELAGRRSVELDAEALRTSDLVLIVTAHPGIDYAAVLREAPLVVDTRNACAGLPTEPGRYFKA